MLIPSNILIDFNHAVFTSSSLKPQSFEARNRNQPERNAIEEVNDKHHRVVLVWYSSSTAYLPDCEGNLVCDESKGTAEMKGHCV